MAAEPEQLGFDGASVPVGDLAPARGPASFSPAQLQILEHIDRHGSIRTTEAGRYVHGHREARPMDAPHREPGECPHALTYRLHNAVPAAAASDRFDWRNDAGRERLACCPWAGADGTAAMKRLKERGVVRSIGQGIWMRA